MTKLQLTNAVQAALINHNANAELTESINDILSKFKSNSKRDKVITVDGQTYVWCNRHERYEVSENFKTEKNPECILATKRWADYGKQIKIAKDNIASAIDAERYDELKSLKKIVDDLTATRAGRFDFDQDRIDFPEIEGYNYDAEAQNG